MDLDKLLADMGEKTISTEVVEATAEIAKEKLEEAPKKKRKSRGGGKNSPVIGMNGYDLEPGDNTKFLTVNMALFNMEKIDRTDVDAVQNRLNEFFMLYGQNDMKPTVAGMAMSLGMDRRTLWAITHDAPLGGRGNLSTLPPSVTDVIKKAYFLLENLWETYMASGKINPVSGIFLGKNNYGYQDKTEYVLTPNQNADNDYDADSIRERYIAADQQKRLSDGSENSED